MKKLIVLFVFLISCSPEFFMTPYQISINRRIEYINSHINLDVNTKNAIRNGQIFNGMTEEQVIASWGKPDKIISSMMITGTLDILEYNFIDKSYNNITYSLDFRNKILYNISNIVLQ